jgi:glutamate synthase domain-containing protein 2
MALASQISAIVAGQLGKIEGELEAKIQLEANKMLGKFSNQCPESKALVTIINTKNALLSGVNKFQKRSDKFLKLANNLKKAIRSAKIILKLLKINPTPVATGIPPSDYGGLISAKTTGSLTSQADRLYNIRRLLENLDGDVSSIESLVAGVSPSLNNIKDLLSNVNSKSEQCVDNLSSGAISDEEKKALKELLTKVQPLENTGSEGLPNDDYVFKSDSGKVYEITIIEDRQGGGPVPRRLAVAKDSIGVILLRGQPSFSADTTVLIEELKFRINNQLP